MELIVGARDKRDLATIDGFLSLCPVVPLSDSIGTGAYRLLKTYAKSHGLHVFDSLIAATAMEKALTLATRNRKHYQMIEGLQLGVPDLLRGDVRPIPDRFHAIAPPRQPGPDCRHTEHHQKLTQLLNSLRALSVLSCLDPCSPGIENSRRVSTNAI